MQFSILHNYVKTKANLLYLGVEVAFLTPGHVQQMLDEVLTGLCLAAAALSADHTALRVLLP